MRGDKYNQRKEDFMQVINNAVYAFSKENAPVATATAGEILTFKTQDCFGQQITSEDQLVHELDLSKANPTAGPVYVEGAMPGDVLVVDILDIQVAEYGFACSIGGTGPLADQSEVRTKIISIEHGVASYNDMRWPIDPMIGVIGTAPAEGEIPCGFAGDHGGNMDSAIIRKGSKVYLPVRVAGGLLQIGDLHATMGDGEVSGTGIEVSGEVLARVSLIKEFELHWPVTETTDAWYVNATAPAYGDSLVAAANELGRLMEPVYGWDMTDIFIYLSLQGNVGVNQGVYPVDGQMINLRFGIPKSLDKKPLIG